MIYSLIKKILFQFDPEGVHNALKTISHVLPKNLLHTFCSYSHPTLLTSIGETPLVSPIGMAAGFDKNADSADLLWALGFGFCEIGTVTRLPCTGNPRPRIFRLPLDRSLINRMGLPNVGVDELIKRLHKKTFHLPLGINIAKTPDTALPASNKAHELNEAVEDIVASLNMLHGLGSYTVINLSCPNTNDPRIFETEQNLEVLLNSIGHISPIRPILLKLSPDLEIDALRKTVDLAIKHDIDGFVIGNTTNSRDSLTTPAETVARIGRGGMSGAALKMKADTQLEEVFEIVGREKILIASGGIMSFRDLLDKLSRGASLFEIYTGLVYEGPMFVKRLNRALAEYCEKVGVKNYLELVGQDLRHALSC